MTGSRIDIPIYKINGIISFSLFVEDRNSTELTLLCMLSGTVAFKELIHPSVRECYRKL